MRTFHIYCGVPLGSQTGWRDDQKRATKTTLPSYLQQNNPNHLPVHSPDLLPGHSLKVELLQKQQQQHRAPYELRICTKRNWHCVQDEERALSDCSGADLTDLRMKNYHVFCIFSSNPKRLTFASQVDAKDLALFVCECLKCCAVAGLFGFQLSCPRLAGTAF